MRVEVDDRSGFCFGVVRAITSAEEAAAEASSIYSLGDIVHNPVEVARLEGLGVHPISKGEFAAMRGGKVLIRAHGEPPATYAMATANGTQIVDATCPVVERLQRLVREAHAQMEQAGGRIVILGKKGHAEVEGLLGQVDGDAVVVEKKEDLDALDFGKPIYFISQTTQSPALFAELTDEIERRGTGEVTVRNTICGEVANRGRYMEEFAVRHDVVVFVSGRKSSNGRALFEICRRVNSRSYMIENEQELQPHWFLDAQSVGVCGATSTPRWLMDKVAVAVAATAATAEGKGLK